MWPLFSVKIFCKRQTRAAHMIVVWNWKTFCGHGRRQKRRNSSSLFSSSEFCGVGEIVHAAACREMWRILQFSSSLSPYCVECWFIGCCIPIIRCCWVRERVQKGIPIYIMREREKEKIIVGNMWKRELRHFMEAAECSAKRCGKFMGNFTDCTRRGMLQFCDEVKLQLAWKMNQN